MIRYNMASVNGSAFVKIPGEIDTHGASGFLDLFKTFVLQISLELIPDGDQVNRHFVFLNIVLADSFKKLREVTGLVEEPNVRIGDRDTIDSPQ